MFPFDRFLLAVMALPLSAAERINLLQRYFCAGASAEMFLESARVLLQHPDASLWGDSFVNHLHQTSTLGEAGEGYVLGDAMSFLMKMGVEPALRALVDTTQTPYKTALQWMTRRIHYRALASLFIANQTSIQIASSMTRRFSKELTEDVVLAMQWLFFRFDDMEEREVVGWSELHDSHDRMLFRMAMTEPAYVVYDHLNMTTNDLGLRDVAARIMHRGLYHFEKLSRINHHRAFSEARKWGDLAMKAAERYEKVKGGEYVDFLAKFQVALMEADASIVPVADGSGEVS